MRLQWWQELIWLTYTLRWSHIQNKYSPHAENLLKLQHFTIIRYYLKLFIYYESLISTKNYIWNTCWDKLHNAWWWLLGYCSMMQMDYWNYLYINQMKLNVAKKQNCDEHRLFLKNKKVTECFFQPIYFFVLFSIDTWQVESECGWSTIIVWEWDKIYMI